MSRWVTCKADLVWKYPTFWEPQLGRLNIDLGVGRFKKPRERSVDDVLEVDRSDLPTLEEYLRRHQAELEGEVIIDNHFLYMVEAIVNYMRERPERQKFVFVGDDHYWTEEEKQALHEARRGRRRGSR